MDKQMMSMIIEMLKQGKEPFMTQEGWTEFYRLMMQFEEGNEVEKSA